MRSSTPLTTGKFCTQCAAPFEITPEEAAFIADISPKFGGKRYEIPLPSQCPACREQQRLSYRNEWNLYHRKCDKTGRQMISIYSSGKPYQVYEQNVWWSDQFDPLSYGREFDFSRPFFEQWQELSLAVPRMSIHNAKSENCEYTNYSAENKSCYMVVGGLGCENNYYSYRPSYCKDICDCYDPFQCELCYEVSESKNLHNCRFCVQCHNSRDLAFCTACTGCADCIGCVNLRQKRFHIFNQSFNEEEYRAKSTELLADPEGTRTRAQELRLTQPHRALDILGCEECTGEHLLNCKDCHNIFIFKDSQRCRHCTFGENNTSCIDVNFSDNCELQYFSSNLEKNYNVLFANLAWYVTDSIYITSCFNSNHLFGCIGMKKHAYCVFNKQYTKEEYEDLVPRIIAHMRRTPLRSPDGSFAGYEWGAYYPAAHSPFGYNESVSFADYPLSESEALARGWKWHGEGRQESYLGPEQSIPGRIEDVSDDITNLILRCSVTRKPFKIIPQELKFYRDVGVPIPNKCPDQRHKERMELRNPRKLWSRKCGKCGKGMETTYSPDRKEIIYCEECYLKEVY